MTPTTNLFFSFLANERVIQNRNRTATSTTRSCHWCTGQIWKRTNGSFLNVQSRVWKFRKRRSTLSERWTFQLVRWLVEFGQSDFSFWFSTNNDDNVRWDILVRNCDDSGCSCVFLLSVSMIFFERPTQVVSTKKSTISHSHSITRL